MKNWSESHLENVSSLKVNFENELYGMEYELIHRTGMCNDEWNENSCKIMPIDSNAKPLIF